MSRCKIWDWWETSPFLSLCSLACFSLILLAHVLWIPIASLECHCAHPSYADNDEHEALASFCVAYYARFCDSQSFTNVVQRCLHDREFLRNWALTHDPLDDYPIEKDSFLASFTEEDIKTMRFAVFEREIPLHHSNELFVSPCRKYTTLLCWAHYWAAFPMIILIVFGAMIAALHVQIYANWRVAENTKLYHSK